MSMVETDRQDLTVEPADLTGDYEVYMIATREEVCLMREELKRNFDVKLQVDGYFENPTSNEEGGNSKHGLKASDTLFHNHFNGSPDFDQEITVEDPQDGDWFEHPHAPLEDDSHIQNFTDLEEFQSAIQAANDAILIYSEAHRYPEAIYDFLQNATDYDVSVYPFADFFRMITNKEPIVNLSDHCFLYDFHSSEKGSNWVYKRLSQFLDLAISSLGVLVLLPLWIVIAGLIKLSSKGPVIYRQRRVGKNGRTFTLYKFRTMVQDAEDNGVRWADEDDDRVTWIGQILRKTRLDETAQFLNVIKGEMSLIGPRPERPEFVSKLRKRIPFYDHRHWVLPGITGWAQINYSYGASIEDSMIKLQYDLYWIKHRDLLMNLKILVKTVGVVLGLKGR